MNSLCAKPYARLLVISLIAVSFVGCVGSPTEKQPELLETAFKELGKGVGYYDDSSYSIANSHFLNALDTFRSIDHREGVALSCLNLAKVNLAKHRLDMASIYIDRAATIIRENTLPNLEEHLAIIRSSLAIEIGNLESAKRYLSDDLEQSKDINISLSALQNKIRIAFLENDTENAQASIVRFETQLKASGNNNSNYQARLHRFRARLLDDPKTVDSQFEYALDLYRKNIHKPGIAATLFEWGTVQITRGSLAEAEDKILRALYIRQVINDRSGSLRILETLDALYEKAGRPDNAELTKAWMKKLGETSFRDWEGFIEAFNPYPEAHPS